MKKDLDILTLNTVLYDLFTRYESLERLLQDINNKSYSIDIKKVQKLIEKLFPNVTEEEKQTFIKYAYYNYKSSISEEKITLVGTLPLCADLNIRRTIPIIESLIDESRNEIMITGYSISSYSKTYFDKIEERLRVGVRAYIFINDDDKLENYLNRFRKYLGNELVIYRYDRILVSENSSLHAKIIISDRKRALITSSNLSYNGFVNNIELGTLVESPQVRKLYETMMKMVEKKYFQQIK